MSQKWQLEDLQCFAELFQRESTTHCPLENRQTPAPGLVRTRFCYNQSLWPFTGVALSSRG